MRLMDEEHVYHVIRLWGQSSVTGTWLRVSYLIYQRGYHTLLRGLMYVGKKGLGLSRGSSHNGSGVRLQPVAEGKTNAIINHSLQHSRWGSRG